MLVDSVAVADAGRLHRAADQEIRRVIVLPELARRHRQAPPQLVLDRRLGHRRIELLDYTCVDRDWSHRHISSREHSPDRRPDPALPEGEMSIPGLSGCPARTLGDPPDEAFPACLLPWFGKRTGQFDSEGTDASNSNQPAGAVRVRARRAGASKSGPEFAPLCVRGAQARQPPLELAVPAAG